MKFSEIKAVIEKVETDVFANGYAPELKEYSLSVALLLIMGEDLSQYTTDDKLFQYVMFDKHRELEDFASAHSREYELIVSAVNERIDHRLLTESKITYTDLALSELIDNLSQKMQEADEDGSPRLDGTGTGTETSVPDPQHTESIS